MGGHLRRRVERAPTFKTLTNAPRKVIDIVRKNADYRRPMSRINLLDTKTPRLIWSTIAGPSANLSRALPFNWVLCNYR